MQYYVPQFIEGESKVIGPLTLKQFLIIIIPSGLIILLLFIFKAKIIIFFLIIAIFISLIFIFFKYQGQELTAITLYSFNYFLTPREYIWAKKEGELITLKEVEVVKTKEIKNIISKKPAEESKLKKLSWSIQIKK